MHQKLHRMTIEHMMPVFTSLVNEGSARVFSRRPSGRMCRDDSVLRNYRTR
jgi:hypothetical protein